MEVIGHVDLYCFISSDAINDIIYSTDDPNDREYDTTNIATWTSISQVDTFFSTYNRSNAYKRSNSDKLKLGNRITISDGTYSIVWTIAGFDVESSRDASDGTTYDNGYGIALVPVISYVSGKWNNSNTLSGGYIASYAHTNTLPWIATNLQNVLGTHLINRNVLLSSAVNGSSGNTYNSSAYTWTTAYCTLMSAGQISGTFASNRNKYDDGEANYQLPAFKKNTSYGSSTLWLRGVWGYYSDDVYAAWTNKSGNISYESVTRAEEICPMIYIR